MKVIYKGLQMVFSHGHFLLPLISHGLVLRLALLADIVLCMATARSR
jgi:hypothetical protein